MCCISTQACLHLYRECRYATRVPCLAQGPEWSEQLTGIVCFRPCGVEFKREFKFIDAALCQSCVSPLNRTTCRYVPFRVPIQETSWTTHVHDSNERCHLGSTRDRKRTRLNSSHAN